MPTRRLQDYYPNLIELYSAVDVTMTPEDYSSQLLGQVAWVRTV